MRAGSPTGWASPHYVIDAEERFARAVIAEFADSYANGETPVPCIRCNQTVKFADLSALARDLGAERLATGHYVRRVDGPDGAELHRAADLARDQSWFLFATTPPAAGHVPVSAWRHGGQAGGARCRAAAGLGVAEKPDSQDICFVPSGAYTDVVTKIRPDALEPGEIVTADGRVVGRHDGIARYTVGQGKRLGDAAMLDGQRQVVVATEPGRRRVVVGPRGTGTVTVHAARRELADSDAVRATLRCAVKLRAREEPRRGDGASRGGRHRVVLDEPALPAPGQACVFYAGDRVLGGGIISAGRASTSR